MPIPEWKPLGKGLGDHITKGERPTRLYLAAAGGLCTGLAAVTLRTQWMGDPRMNFWRITAVLVILGAVGADVRETSAQKDTRTGTEMLPSCRAFLEGPEALKNATQEENLRAGFCAGYVIGMLTEETEACVPPIKASDAVRTVIEHIEAHSDQLNEPFDDLVERALTTIWPCKP